MKHYDIEPKELEKSKPILRTNISSDLTKRQENFIKIKSILIVLNQFLRLFFFKEQLNIKLFAQQMKIVLELLYAAQINNRGSL